MINKFLLLTKTSIFLTFSPKKMFSKQNAATTKGKSFGYAVLALFMLGYFFVLSTLFFYNLGDALYKINALDLMLYLTIIAYTAIILLITIISAQGYLYKAKDLQLLLSLPVSHFTVLLSKFMLLYIYELFFALMLIGPAFGVYFYILGSCTIFGIISAVLCFFAAPLLPLAIGSLLSYFVGLLTRRMHRKNFLTIVISLVFLVGWIVLTQNFQGILNYILNHSDTLQQAFTRFYFPSVLLADSLQGEILKALLFLLCGAAAVFIVFALISKKYSDIVSIMNSSDIRKKYKAQTFNEKRSSALNAMIKKELSCYFSSANYVLNTILGPILLVLGSASLLFMDLSTFTSVMSTADFDKFSIAIAAAMMAFIPSISPTTTSTISLEGKKLWIYKSLPASVKDILKAKIAVNLIISLPEILISGVLLCIALGFGVLDYFLLIALGFTFCLFFSMAGILINLSHPKLDFENEIVVIKQSASVLLAMLLNFGIIAGCVILYILTSPQNFYIFAIPLLFVFLVLVALFTKRLFNWGVKRFNAL